MPKFDDPARTSQWTSTGSGLEISVAAAGEAHDVALEILTRLSQALWERLSKVEESGYWRLLDAEILANISGEMDEQALDAKRLLLEDRAHARDPRCLEQYGVASFAATAAEYVHCLWHDVTIRTGEAYLPAPQLRRRLELMARFSRQTADVPCPRLAGIRVTALVEQQPVARPSAASAGSASLASRLAGNHCTRGIQRTIPRSGGGTRP